MTSSYQNGSGDAGLCAGSVEWDVWFTAESWLNPLHSLPHVSTSQNRLALTKFFDEIQLWLVYVWEW